MPTAPSARRIIEISLLRIIKWKNFALRSFRFGLFLQLLIKIFFDSTSLSPSRLKIRFKEKFANFRLLIYITQVLFQEKREKNGMSRFPICTVYGLYCSIIYVYQDIRAIFYHFSAVKLGSIFHYVIENFSPKIQ